MTDFIKEEKRRIAMLVDGKDYHISCSGYPIVSFEEIKFEDGYLFLGKQIRNYNPIWFCDCFEYVCQYIFEKNEAVNQIGINKVVDENISQELANRGIFENRNYCYVVTKTMQEPVKGMKL